MKKLSQANLDAQRLAALREQVVAANVQEHRLREPAANDYAQRIIYESEVDAELHKLASIEDKEEFLIKRRQELGNKCDTALRRWRWRLMAAHDCAVRLAQAELDMLKPPQRTDVCFLGGSLRSLV